MKVNLISKDKCTISRYYEMLDQNSSLIIKMICPNLHSAWGDLNSFIHIFLQLKQKAYLGITFKNLPSLVLIFYKVITEENWEKVH